MICRTAELLTPSAHDLREIHLGARPCSRMLVTPHGLIVPNQILPHVAPAPTDAMKVLADYDLWCQLLSHLQES